MCKNICRVFVCSAKNNHHPFLFVAFYTNMLYWVKSFVFVVLSFGKGGGEMRFLMLFLRLVLCAVCLFALCPSVPQAAGSDTPDSLPLLAQERIQEQDSCLLAAPGAAFSAPARRGMPPQRAACAAAAVGVGALWCCLVHCRHACRARRSHRPCLRSQRRGGHAPPCPCI